MDDGGVFVEALDHVRHALVKIDRAGKDGCVRTSRIHCSEQDAGFAVDDGHRAALAAEADHVVGVCPQRSVPKPAVWAPPQQAAVETALIKNVLGAVTGSAAALPAALERLDEDLTRALEA